MARTAHPAFAALALAALALAVAPADGRTTVIYESAANHAALTGTQPDGSPGLGPGDGALQQQPAPRHLTASAQAWKVSGNGGSRATPSIVGRKPAATAALLEDRVRRSGAHLVFVDELGSRFRGGEGDRLAAALGLLQRQRSPWGGASLAERVHIYVPSPRVMLAAPDAWGGAWTALVRSGGVWIETYRNRRPWTEEEWLAWPAAFREEFVRRGGDPGRLHLVLTAGDQSEQWRRARTGAACELLGNGPAAYRLGDDAHDFVREYRAAFGSGELACHPSPLLPPERARDLAVVLGSIDRGVRLGGARLGAPPLWSGRAARVTVRLGSDPLALARRLGVPAADYWRRSGAFVRARGAGLDETARLRADGTAELRVRPTAPGAVWLDLIVPGGPIRSSLQGPHDLSGSLRPFAPWIGSGYRRTVLDPGRFRLRVPLRLPGREGGSPTLGVREPPPPTQATELRLRRVGAGSAKRLGLDPRRAVLVLATLRTAAGLPVPGTRLAVRRPDGKGRTVATDAFGRAYVRLSRRAGVLRVVARGSKATARLRLSRP